MSDYMMDEVAYEKMRQEKIAKNKAKNLACKTCQKESRRGGSAYGTKCASKFSKK